MNSLLVSGVVSGSNLVRVQVHAHIIAVIVAVFVPLAKFVDSYYFVRKGASIAKPAMAMQPKLARLMEIGFDGMCVIGDFGNLRANVAANDSISARFSNECVQCGGCGKDVVSTVTDLEHVVI